MVAEALLLLLVLLEGVQGLLEAVPLLALRDLLVHLGLAQRLDVVLAALAFFLLPRMLGAPDETTRLGRAREVLRPIAAQTVLRRLLGGLRTFVGVLCRLLVMRLARTLALEVLQVLVPDVVV